ncbi:MAG: GxxExxY protein [Bacteroidetes bacterium]|nr:GxxExxY protein [Bacteroidota bacterium]
MLYGDLTEDIIGAFYDVNNSLGHGFLERVYENALALELRSVGMIIEQQKPIKVYYKKQIVGEYFADIIVNDLVILELKVVDKILREHEAQLLNYLRATDIEVGLLLNFGTNAEFRRKYYTNDRKGRKID